MVDSKIEDVHNEGLEKLHDKFSTDKNEKDAEKYFLMVLDDCISAVFARINDRIHIWADYFKWRSIYIITI